METSAAVDAAAATERSVETGTRRRYCCWRQATTIQAWDQDPAQNHVVRTRADYDAARASMGSSMRTSWADVKRQLKEAPAAGVSASIIRELDARRAVRLPGFVV